MDKDDPISTNESRNRGCKPHGPNGWELGFSINQGVMGTNIMPQGEN